MTDPTALAPEGAEWLRAVAGVAVWMIPGLAIADRWMPGRARWAWAPLWSAASLSLSAILLDFGLGVPVRTGTTLLLALGLAALAGWPRIRSWLRRAPLRRRAAPTAEPTLSWGEAAAGLAAIGLVVCLAAIPHMPGPAPAGVLDTLPNLVGRVAGAGQGEGLDPYPLHVDEHYHMAQVAAIERTGRVEPPDPYTGQPSGVGFLSVSGLRSEHGFWVGLAQLRLLTDVPLAFLFLVLPALGSGFLAGTVWLTLRPAAGATASAAFVGIAHTTVRFLGPAFLVPSALGLPWVLACILLVLKGKGPARLAALFLLVTSAFVMHIVIGVVVLTTGVLAALCVPNSTGRNRLGLVAAVLVPLVWIGPYAFQDAKLAVSSTNALPFDAQFFRVPGMLLLGAAVAGVFLAWAGRPKEAPHRVLSLLCLGILASLIVSIWLDHANEATYARLVHIFFVSLAGLAGLALGTAAGWLRRRRELKGALGASAPAIGVAMCIILLVPAIGAHLREPYYRTFDDEAWAQLQTFAAAHPGPDAVFLSDPYRSPIFNAYTGARPWAAFYPGAPPPKDGDYRHFEASHGANATWINDRGITWFLTERPPAAPYEDLGHGVYRVE